MALVDEGSCLGTPKELHVEDVEVEDAEDEEDFAAVEAVLLECCGVEEEHHGEEEVGGEHAYDFGAPEQGVVVPAELVDVVEEEHAHDGNGDVEKDLDHEEVRLVVVEVGRVGVAEVLELDDQVAHHHEHLDQQAQSHLPELDGLKFLMRWVINNVRGYHFGVVLGHAVVHDEPEEEEEGDEVGDVDAAEDDGGPVGVEDGDGVEGVVEEDEQEGHGPDHLLLQEDLLLGQLLDPEHVEQPGREGDEEQEEPRHDQGLREGPLGRDSPVVDSLDLRHVRVVLEVEHEQVVALLQVGYVGHSPLGAVEVA